MKKWLLSIGFPLMLLIGGAVEADEADRTTLHVGDFDLRLGLTEGGVGYAPTGVILGTVSTQLAAIPELGVFGHLRMETRPVPTGSDINYTGTSWGIIGLNWRPAYWAAVRIGAGAHVSNGSHVQGSFQMVLDPGDHWNFFAQTEFVSNGDNWYQLYVMRTLGGQKSFAVGVMSWDGFHGPRLEWRRNRSLSDSNRRMTLWLAPFMPKTTFLQDPRFVALGGFRFLIQSPPAAR